MMPFFIKEYFEKYSKVVADNLFYNLDYSFSPFQFKYFRIIIAFYSLLSFISYIIDYDIFLSSTGLISWEVTDASAYWFEPHLLKLSNFLSINKDYVLICFSTLNLTTLFLLMIGVYTRLTSILCFAFHLIFSVILHPYQYGVDLYHTVFLLFLTIFPSGFSKCRFKNNKIINIKLENQQKIGIRTIQLYLCLTYFSAGFGKSKMDSWYNGEFIFLSLSDSNYHFLNFPLDINYNIFLLLGIFVIIIESLYFIFICIPYLRTILIISISLMHLFISFFMGLFPFGILLFAVNIVSWYPLLIIDFKKILKLKQ